MAISVLLLIVLLFSCFLKANQKTTPQPMPVPNQQGQYEIKVHLGESAQDVYRRNPNMFKVNASGVGPGFMRPVLPFKEIEKIKIVLMDTDQQPIFAMDHIKDLRLVNDDNIPHLGIDNLLVDTATSGENLNDKQLYELYAKIRDMLKNYGWQAYIDPEDPRVFGKASWENKSIGLKDGFYIDRYEKWQKYIADGNIFVMFKRENLIAKVSVSSVLSDIEIETAAASYLYRYDEKTRVEHWREYLQQDIPKWKISREKQETEFRKQGISIDENYIDVQLPK
ncbi:hypothetical protein [Acinetobacter gerneri]|nr:hypothetical protein [Acinetobacter gerneri]EPR82778.1 hypothetical protein L289_2696 [Acinetobacter gerneri DSM 14967 = CIP 107464 = MTCC 9824]